MDVAKLFKNGRSQAVRLPKEYRFEGSDVYVKKFEDIVLLIPRDTEWKTLEASLRYFSDDFLQERDQPDIQDRNEIE